MAEEKFRLPGSSYPELTKIIKAYAHARPDSSVEDVAKLAMMNRTTISRSTVFLTSVGIIQGGHKKSITEDGRALAQALEHEIPEEITRHWRRIVEPQEYFQKLLAAVRIRNGMDTATLLAHAAYTAGQGNTPDAKTGAGAAIDILRAAGLLVEQDGKLFVSRSETTLTTPPLTESHRKESGSGEAPSPNVPPHPPAQPSFPVVTVQSPAPAVAVNIQINIDCTPAELAGLGEHLGAILAMVRTPAGTPNETGVAGDSPASE